MQLTTVFMTLLALTSVAIAAPVARSGEVGEVVARRDVMEADSLVRRAGSSSKSKGSSSGKGKKDIKIHEDNTATKPKPKDRGDPSALDDITKDHHKDDNIQPQRNHATGGQRRDTLVRRAGSSSKSKGTSSGKGKKDIKIHEDNTATKPKPKDRGDPSALDDITKDHHKDDNIQPQRNHATGGQRRDTLVRRAGSSSKSKGSSSGKGKKDIKIHEDNTATKPKPKDRGDPSALDDITKDHHKDDNIQPQRNHATGGQRRGIMDDDSLVRRAGSSSKSKGSSSGKGKKDIKIHEDNTATKPKPKDRGDPSALDDITKDHHKDDNIQPQRNHATGGQRRDAMDDETLVRRAGSSKTKSTSSGKGKKDIKIHEDNTATKPKPKDRGDPSALDDITKDHHKDDNIQPQRNHATGGQ